MMPFLDAAAVAAALPFDRLVPALRAAFLDDVTAPQRHRHALPDGATLLLMPAWRRDFVGVKIVTVHPDNAALGLDAVNSCYLLSDAATGRPVALIEGDTLTARRTAAASALAASYLARPEASTLLLVGAGRVASLLPAAHRSVRPIREVMVWNRSAARRDALVAALNADGFQACAVDDLAAAATTADIISSATVSTAPLIQGRWLRPGVHLDLVGAFMPSMREADADALVRAAVYADTLAALTECGELAGMDEAGLAGTLATLCRGGARQRRAEVITLFKSVGTAIEDLAAAVLAAGAQPTKVASSE
jgi:ornithine cyclodeaminase/alanine dehydrogenase-like protein (mu-crystallin family)